MKTAANTPTPEEIKRACEEIQRGWTSRQRCQRRKMAARRQQTLLSDLSQSISQRQVA